MVFLDWIGQWAKKNDVIDFEFQGIKFKRVFTAPQAQFMADAKAPLPDESQELTENEKMYGVGGIEWQR